MTFASVDRKQVVFHVVDVLARVVIRTLAGKGGRVMNPAALNDLLLVSLYLRSRCASLQLRR